MRELIKDDMENTAVQEDLSPIEYYRLRSEVIAALKNGIEENNPYPHKFEVSITLEDFNNKYKDLNSGDVEKETVSLAGRVHAIRKSGSKLIFYDLKTEGFDVVVIANATLYDTEDRFAHDTTNIRRGDIIGCAGHPGRTETGELYLVLKTVKLLSPCLHKLPRSNFGLKDNESRFRQRYLDLILNDEVRKVFVVRARIVSYLRRFLDNLGFLEVETAMMQAIPGGASARPFVTHYDEYDVDLHMRIAPELYLKMLVVGGLERVYEIGRQFRNEKPDSGHNPEFTTCEFYMAYSDYQDLINITETFLSGLVKSIHGTYKIKYHPDGPDGEAQEIDFTPPFRRVSMIETLESVLSVKFPPAEQLSTPQGNAFLSALCEQHKVDCPEPRTSARLLGSLVGSFIEDGITDPTFVMDHPQVLSPLAKNHRSLPGLSERFELFVMRKELCNAYTELNDPATQRERFMQQCTDRAAGDEESPPFDDGFVRALEYGLPPTAGWGLGIERLTMLLTDTNDIKEVLLFPAMKLDETNKYSAEENSCNLPMKEDV